MKAFPSRGPSCRLWRVVLVAVLAFFVMSLTATAPSLAKGKNDEQAYTQPAGAVEYGGDADGLGGFHRRHDFAGDPVFQGSATNDLKDDPTRKLFTVFDLIVWLLLGPNGATLHR